MRLWWWLGLVGACAAPPASTAPAAQRPAPTPAPQDSWQDSWLSHERWWLSDLIESEVFATGDVEVCRVHARWRHDRTGTTRALEVELPSEEAARTWAPYLVDRNAMRQGAGFRFAERPDVPMAEVIAALLAGREEISPRRIGAVTLDADPDGVTVTLETKAAPVHRIRWRPPRAPCPDERGRDPDDG